MVRVEDVREFPGHIACDGESRSEIVVPVFGRGGEVSLLGWMDGEGWVRGADWCGGRLWRL